MKRIVRDDGLRTSAHPTVLENHLHLIAQSPNLPAEIASFKSWTAKRLLEVLKEQRAEHVLKQLAFYKKTHKHDRDYQVWEEGSHPEQIQKPCDDAAKNRIHPPKSG
ncbi:hypothetical protein [Candidatus Methylomicrobium oryzae]|uniref:hypothetical protein n=1 Tax=Candidatus Methylomicrobium oryzae TaxID=2802053 RepID=UPI001924C8AF|nr:hypothetical protein [Methylomicrobium sp. RS1]MBL1265751.1 hypothetical protein [Methylomicrobium sp. RS1]